MSSKLFLFDQNLNQKLDQKLDLKIGQKLILKFEPKWDQ